MKIVQTSDYRIYFDDVRMDPYIKQWSAGCGLQASDATASLTMYRTKKLEEWKGYLTQVRVFALNVFSGKYCIVFEGEITNRNWSDARVDTGEITFSCKGFYHWLNVPIPMIIGMEETMDHIRKFEYAASNIDVEAVEEIYSTRADLIMKDKPIKDIIETLFDKLYTGYYLSDDSTFTWADLKNRFKIMGDVVKEYRDAGYLDTLTFIRTTQIETFYVYLTNVLTMLMFEFYQDRDGALRVKTPSWSDDILKAHILDESIIQSASGFNDWENEPTRVLVKGGPQDVGTKGSPARGASNVMQIPMGLYIGKPGEGEYFSQNIQVEMMFGTDTGDYIGDDGGGAGGTVKAAKYYLSEFRVSTPFAPGGIDDGVHTDGHRGIDLAKKGSESIEGKPIYSLSTGTVTEVILNSESAGNGVRIQAPDNKLYSYIHMMEAPPVSKGDTISGGQTIGKIGSTGHSTGPHLDLKIKDANGTYIDPLKVIKEIAAGPDDSAGGSGGGTAPTGDQAKFMNQDLKNQSNLNMSQISSWINSKAKKGSVMYDRGKAFYDAAKESGLDPIYLVSHAAHETGWGTSPISKNKGNFYGIGAYDSSPAKSAFDFGGYDAGIIEGAKWIRKNYYDRGQNTLYKMRYSVDGKHNYATDPAWPNKIANIMKGAGKGSGESGGDYTPTTGSPNAATGGTVVKTSYGKSYTGFGNYGGGGSAERVIARLPGAQKNADHVANTPVIYNGPQAFRISYPIPLTDLGNYIRTSPNGVEHNMIGCIIEVASGWKDKFSSSTHVGLMGISQNYINTQPNVSKLMLLDGQTNVLHGTQLFSNAYKRFGNKVTFALASLYLGNMKLVEDAITKAGAEDFTKARAELNKINKGAANFVDRVITVYTELFGADYIKGDPHYPITKNGKIDGEIDETVVQDPEVVEGEYESSYKPIMSDEERLYKVNLKVSEQQLIRYDVETSEDQIYTADEMVERYAKYMMQLFRAESHGVNITLSTCLPFLRPGFNAWFEPTRRNFVFYITRVMHQGSYGSGAFTTVNGGFVRDPKTYSSIEDNIFVADTYAKAADFGSTVNVSNMNAIKEELRTLHSKSNETIGDARKIPTLSKLYSSATAKKTEYSTVWGSELTSKEIADKLSSLYKDAPKVVKKRKKKLKKIIDEAGDFFTKMLLQTKR